MPANLDQLTCPGCGYALRGLPDNICPECGAPFDADTILEALRDAPRREHAVGATAIALVAGASSVPLSLAFGLDAVQPSNPYACGRTRHAMDGDMFIVILLVTLIAPCVACAVLSPLSPRVLARIARIGLLAAVTSWTTLFVILSTAR